MSRLDISADVRVYQEDTDAWGASHSKFCLETYWNDQAGDYVVLTVPGGAKSTATRKTTMPDGGTRIPLP